MIMDEWIKAKSGYIIAEPEYVEQLPYVDEDGIYIPECRMVLKGTASCYRMIISKEMFIEAYNKWIKGE